MAAVVDKSIDSGYKSESLQQTDSVDHDAVKRLLVLRRLEYSSDGKHIRWSPSNKKHPRNWSKWRKAYDTSCVIFLDFFTTAVSTSGSSAADRARGDFGLGQTEAVLIFVSLYLFGQMVGGIIFPPYSEVFGRKKLYIISACLYSVSCVFIGFTPSLGGIAVGRFVSGLLSAIPTTVVVGSIEDMFDSKARNWIIFLWNMLANTGLATGPIMSVYIAEYTNWRCVFYVNAVVTAVTAVFLFGIRESRPALILEREVAFVREQTGDDALKALNPDHTPDLKTFINVAVFRPAHLFFTEPIVFIVASMSAFAAALIYLFTEALPPVYKSLDFSTTSSYLPLLAICVGLPLGLFTRLWEHRKIKRYQRKDLVLDPEKKLLGFSTAAPLLAGGMWWFTWTIPPATTNLPWIVPTAALVLVGFSINEFDSVLASYLADSYLSYAASGFAALSILRSLMSAAFPMLAPKLFGCLGANMACMALAILSTIFCLVPPLFTKFGKQIRTRSKFARYSLEVYQENGID